MLKYPVVKFLCHVTSFLIFLTLIVLLTVESSTSVSNSKTLKNLHPEVFGTYTELYILAYNRTGNVSSLAGPNFPLRASQPTTTEIMLSLWILGECKMGPIRLFPVSPTWTVVATIMTSTDHSEILTEAL